MSINSKLAESSALVAILGPVTVVNAAQFSTWVDMSKFDQVMFLASLGDMAAETVDFEVRYADDNVGTNSVTLKAATQRAASAAANDGKQIKINITAAELAPSGKRFVAGRLITGGATGGPASIIGLAVPARYSPESGFDLSSVVEIKL